MFTHNQPARFRDLPKNSKVDDATYKVVTVAVALLLLVGAALA